MAKVARSPLGRDKPARSLELLTRGASGLTPDAVRNTAGLKGPAGFPASGPVALANTTAGVKAKLTGVPVNPREPFARAAAAYRPAGE